MEYSDIRLGAFLKFEDEEETFTIIVTRKYSVDYTNPDTHAKSEIHTFDGIVLARSVKTIEEYEAHYEVGEMLVHGDEACYVEVGNPFTSDDIVRIGDLMRYTQGSERYTVRVDEILAYDGYFTGVIVESNIDEDEFRVGDFSDVCVWNRFKKVL